MIQAGCSPTLAEESTVAFSVVVVVEPLKRIAIFCAWKRV